MSKNQVINLSKLTQKCSPTPAVTAPFCKIKLNTHCVCWLCRCCFCHRLTPPVLFQCFTACSTHHKTPREKKFCFDLGATTNEKERKNNLFVKNHPHERAAAARLDGNQQEIGMPVWASAAEYLFFKWMIYTQIKIVQSARASAFNWNFVCVCV